MAVTLLATKLYIPPSRPTVVLRSRLTKRLDRDLHRKLTLVSAPAGFGKTTLVSEWVAACKRPVAWLSLDEAEGELTRFLAYLIAALQTVSPTIGKGIQGRLESPQPPPTTVLLTALLNDITTLPDKFVLVLDDYHVVDAEEIDEALTFLLEHLPPQLHVVITTREDPQLPLARLRARGELTELRAADLRFSSGEAAEFLNQVMNLNLSAEAVSALEKRTEGWITGLQLAALSLRGRADSDAFVRAFTGSHRFVLDYLLEEVLHQQRESVQTFLLRTSVLERLCGPLCDAVLQGSAGSGQETLAYLERANLFLIPLDNERRWYRYHHLFAELLRQRLPQNAASSAERTSAGAESEAVSELHQRASTWYEDQGLELEAFHHAAAANDIERAARLVEGEGTPLLFRGAVAPVLGWLESLPKTVLDARPSLWVIYASALIFVGQPKRIEETLQAAEAALQNTGQGQELDDKARDQLGHIASIRATLAIPHHQVETILAESRRALAYLYPHNLPVRTATMWTLGFASQLQGDRAAARQAYTEAVTNSEAIGHIVITLAATTGLGYLQETDNQLYLAAQTYRCVLQLAGDPPWSLACEAHLGLARIRYEWNELDAALEHAQQSVQLAQQQEMIDTFVACKVFLARLKLAHGDVTGATTDLAEAERFARQRSFVHQLPKVAAAQGLVLLQQGKLMAAAQLAETHDLLIGQARVQLAQGDPSAALAVLGPLRQQAEAKGWKDEQLELTLLQALAYDAHGEKELAMQSLSGALGLAEPGGFIRTFLGEGDAVQRLLLVANTRGVAPDYTRTLLTAFGADNRISKRTAKASAVYLNELTEPLSPRELEVLELIAEGLSNQAIAERLSLSLSTVKGHNRNIFGKLLVQRRTEAVAKARALSLL